MPQKVLMIMSDFLRIQIDTGLKSSKEFIWRHYFCILSVKLRLSRIKSEVDSKITKNWYFSLVYWVNTYNWRSNKQLYTPSNYYLFDNAWNSYAKYVWLNNRSHLQAKVRNASKWREKWFIKDTNKIDLLWSISVFICQKRIY